MIAPPGLELETRHRLVPTERDAASLRGADVPLEDLSRADVTVRRAIGAAHDPVACDPRLKARDVVRRDLDRLVQSLRVLDPARHASAARAASSSAIQRYPAGA